MVNNSVLSLDATFAALADPTRRAILARLTRGPAPVTELARPFEVSLPAISRHLRTLESAGLIARRREGRVHRIRLRPRPLREAAAWISRYERFWERRLDALEVFLEKSEEEKS
jgi:DNA-binding transcriptional ArsR family regulator